MQKPPSPYAQLLQRGPFPGQVDPFAEMSKYFHQIHDNLIGSIAAQIAGAILDLGHVVSQEDSIQIGEVEHKPDDVENAIHIREMETHVLITVIEVISPSN